MSKSESEIEDSLKKLSTVRGMNEFAKLLGGIFRTSNEQRKMYEELSEQYKHLRTDLEFERNRRKLAEEYISISPCDYDIHPQQKRCYDIWQTTKGAHEMWLRGEL